MMTSRGTATTGPPGAAARKQQQGQQSHLDPRKDKLAYFKDNFQTHDEDDFDPKIYYYPRQEKEPPHAGASAASVLGGSDHLQPPASPSRFPSYPSPPTPSAAVPQQAAMFPGHNATMPVVHSVQASHGLASMGSRGPAPVVPGLGPLSMTTVGVASLGGAGGGGGGGSGAGAGANGPRSGAGVSASEASGLGRYGASSAGPSLSMAHSGPPGPGPTMHGIGQLGVAGGMGGSRSGQVMASRGQQQQLGGGVQNISGGLARPQASHGGMVGPAGLNPPPPAASSPPIGSAQLSRQGGASAQSAISLPSTSSSYNPSVELFTMINRQGSGGGGGIVNGNGFTPQPPIGTMKQMPINLQDPKAARVGAAAPGASAAGGKQEISLHDMTEFPALGMQHKGMAQQQKDQMLRLTPEDFPTLSPAGYKQQQQQQQQGEGMGAIGGHQDGVVGEQLNENAILGMNPQFHGSGGYGTATAPAASGKGGGGGGGGGVGHSQHGGQAFAQMSMGHNTAGIRSPTSPMGSSQPYEQFVPHMRLAQTLSKTPPVPDRFGLLGLLSVIRMTDPDLNTLALGTDLTTLGLNLNSPDCLYASFTSPFADGPSRKEPEYHLPLCYYMQPPMQPAESKVQLFSDETLIYAFYALPRDLLQVTAAVELYNRDWRFHKALQLWFIRVDSEPVAKTTGYERGTYIFFDVTNWKKVKKENFLLYYDQIAELPKLLPLQPIGPPSGSPALTSPAQALNQHSSSKDSPLVQARPNRRGFDMD